MSDYEVKLMKEFPTYLRAKLKTFGRDLTGFYNRYTGETACVFDHMVRRMKGLYLAELDADVCIHELCHAEGIIDEFVCDTYAWGMVSIFNPDVINYCKATSKGKEAWNQWDFIMALYRNYLPVIDVK